MQESPKSARPRLGHTRAERPARAEAGHHRACDTASPPQEAVRLMTPTRHALEDQQPGHASTM